MFKSHPEVKRLNEKVIKEETETISKMSKQDLIDAIEIGKLFEENDKFMEMIGGITAKYFTDMMKDRLKELEKNEQSNSHQS